MARPIALSHCPLDDPKPGFRHAKLCFPYPLRACHPAHFRRFPTRNIRQPLFPGRTTRFTLFKVPSHPKLGLIQDVLPSKDPPSTPPFPDQPQPENCD